MSASLAFQEFPKATTASALEQAKLAFRCLAFHGSDQSMISRQMAQIGHHSRRIRRLQPLHFCHGRLLLTEQQINYPASQNMDAWLAAVVQDVGVGAAGVFQGVCQDRQAIKGSVIVDGLGQRGGVGVSQERSRAMRVGLVGGAAAVVGDAQHGRQNGEYGQQHPP
jgi:hypothetical protein